MVIITLKYILYSIWLNFRNSKQPLKALFTTVYPFIPSRQQMPFFHSPHIHSIKFIFLNVSTMHKHSKNEDDINQLSSVALLLLPPLLLLSRLSRVQFCATPQTAAHQALLSLGFSRQEHWSGLPLPSPLCESEKWKWSHSVVSDS